MNYDRIILELMDRVSALEDEVATLKSQNDTTNVNTSVTTTTEISTYRGRDKTKYMLNGARYGKNRLVLAIITEYCNRNPNITTAELFETFDRSLQGSLGVVRTLFDVQKILMVKPRAREDFSANPVKLFTPIQTIVLFAPSGVLQTLEILLQELKILVSM